MPEIYSIVVIGTFVFFLLTFFIVYIGVFQNRKKAHFKQELMRAKIEIKEQTLQHLAYELHDNLGQVASLIKIHLNTIEWDDLKSARAKIEDTKGLTRQLIADLKGLTLSLNGDRITQLGIVLALSQLCENVNRTGQLSCTLTTEGVIKISDANTITILYRMAQELLNNSIKHSEAQHITIHLKKINKLFTLVISDDGVGFNHEVKIKGGGSGLFNLQSRALLIGARLDVQSTAGKGTKIAIELPL